MARTEPRISQKSREIRTKKRTIANDKAINQTLSPPLSPRVRKNAQFLPASYHTPARLRVRAVVKKIYSFTVD